MKAETESYQLYNIDSVQEPRYVLSIEFDANTSDITYLTSHSDALVPPGTAAIDRIDGVIMPQGISGQSQRIIPDKAQHTIGSVTFTLLNISGELSAKIKAKLDSDFGMRRKVVRLYKGFSGLTSWDDYSLRLTYLIDSASNKDGVYTIQTSDIQRSTKTTIFDIHQGVLTSTITDVATLPQTIPVTIAAASTKFPILEHDANFTANPSASVGYIKIDDEIICHSGWADPGTYTLLQVVSRGALNTQPATHTVTASDPDQKKRVEEYVYIEMSVLRLVYALLTGVVVNQTGDLPSHWNLGINTSYVTLTDFTDVGMNDLWNQANDSGKMVRFNGIKSTDAKKFIENELLLWSGTFMPIYANGAYGLKRFKNVLPYSPFSTYIATSQITGYRELLHDYDSVINNISVDWNWLDNLQQYRKKTQVINSNSIARWGLNNVREFAFRGVFTGAHTDQDVISYFNQLGDRYFGPPLKLKLGVMPRWDAVEVGEIIRVDLGGINDFYLDTALSRSFEVQQISTNWVTGAVELDLFGGTEAGVLDPISSTVLMSDDYYVAQAITDGGTELSTVLTISGGAVTANGTLTGLDATRKIYYYNGDLTINSGITVDWTKNIELRIKGSLVINGTLTGSSAGALGAISIKTPTTAVDDGPPIGVLGTVGAVGDPGMSYGVFRAGNTGGFPASYPTTTLFESYDSTARSITGLVITNPDGLSLTGIPANLQGSSGSAGNASAMGASTLFPGRPRSVGYGGDGGASGGGVLIVSRGASFGGSGLLSTDGGNGTAGTGEFATDAITLYGASGVGGSAGGIVWLIDGAGSLPDKTNLQQNTGDSAQASTNVTIELGATVIVRSSQTVRSVTTRGVEDQRDVSTYFGYIPTAQNGFAWFPADEIQEVTGYDNKPTDWDNITDPNNTKPVDNANIAPTTYAQAAAPTINLLTGDLWADTDDGNTLYRWNGSAWIAIPDADIAAAIADAAQAIADAATAQAAADAADAAAIAAAVDAAAAQATADGKIVTYYQTTAPGGGVVGDLWVDTDDGNKLYRFNGSGWDTVQDTSIAAAAADATTAIADAATAQGTADGKVVTFVSASTPTADGVGDLWFDTSANNKLYRWSGSAWVAYAQEAAVWSLVTGTGVPDDNADVTLDQISGNGINVLNYEYSVGEDQQPILGTVLNGTATYSTTSYLQDYSYLLHSSAGSMVTAYMGISSLDYNMVLSPNSKFLFSAWVRSPGTSVEGKFGLKDQFATVWTSAVFTTSGTANTWTRVKGVIDITSGGATRFVAALVGDQTGTSDMYFDGLMLEEMIGTLEVPGNYNFPSNISSGTQFYTAAITATGGGTITVSGANDELAYSVNAQDPKVNVQGGVQIISVSAGPAPSGSIRFDLPFTSSNNSATHSQYADTVITPVYITGLNTLADGWYRGDITGNRTYMTIRSDTDSAIADEVISGTWFYFDYFYNRTL